ncbi:MAG: metallophosphoesterase family protein [Nocardioides sp.]
MSSLFVVSDVHGYHSDFRDALAGAGLVDGEGAWTGGDAQLWILGDLLDRGPDGIGVVDLVMSLQKQAPDNVTMLMGNHEILALGYKLFSESRFGDVWAINGGHASDQDGLTDEHVAWMRALPVVGRHEGYLMKHSDTTDYLEWGESIDEINETVTTLLADDDAEAHWEVFATLTSRYGYAGNDGKRVAEEVLATLGGRCIVHGHSIIGTLTNQPSETIEGPIAYADGLVVDIDGGRYDGGPLLLVELELTSPDS